MLNDFATDLPAIRELMTFRQHFTLSPPLWHSFQPAPALSWQCVKFGKSTANQVPKVRGIYAFVIQFQDHDAPPIVLPSHGYITYVGITGQRSSRRTLRDRYGDYLQEKERPKRVQIGFMLNNWPDDLYFHFAKVDAAVDLAGLETALNDAIMPPYGTNDFSAAARRRGRAFRAT